jgi:phage terminase large subunit-like protein
VRAGPRHVALFADELASWQNPEQTWDMAMFGLRMEPGPAGHD